MGLLKIAGADLRASVSAHAAQNGGQNPTEEAVARSMPAPPPVPSAPYLPPSMANLTADQSCWSAGWPYLLH